MSLELFQKIINEIAENQIADYVSFHVMGEPLLHPQFLQMLEYASLKNMKIHLITNISLLNDASIDAMLRNVAILELSLQSFDESSFAQRGAAALTYGDYIAIVKKLLHRKLEMGAPARINVSLMENSANAAKGFPSHIKVLDGDTSLQTHLKTYWYDFFKTLSFDFGVNLSMPATVVVRNFSHEFLPGITIATRYAMNWANSITESEHVFPALFAKCNGLSGQLGILWNGDVVPCCADFEAKIVLGNCTHTQLKAIVTTKQALTIKHGLCKGVLHHEQCKRCKGGTTAFSWFAIQLYSFIQFRHL